MKNKLSDVIRLNHILESIETIQQFTKETNYSEYKEDLKLRLALVKLLEIIGEASNGITQETQNKFNDIEWAILKSLRNVLVHEYFGIDYDIIWNAIQQKIPELKVKIQTIQKDLNAK